MIADKESLLIGILALSIVHAYVYYETDGYLFAYIEEMYTHRLYSRVFSVVHGVDINTGLRTYRSQSAATKAVLVLHFAL